MTSKKDEFPAEELEITKERDVLSFFSAENREECERHVYKYTDCGAWIQFHNWGIELGSIVEGCNFGTAIYPLRYQDGFTGKDIQQRIDAVEKEAEALWEWANTCPDGGDETYAEIGLEAPDVDHEFLHLNPSDRSS